MGTKDHHVLRVFSSVASSLSDEILRELIHNYSESHDNSDYLYLNIFEQLVPAKIKIFHDTSLLSIILSKTVKSHSEDVYISLLQLIGKLLKYTSYKMSEPQI
jgi:hypothetical protein